MRRCPWLVLLTWCIVLVTPASAVAAGQTSYTLDKNGQRLPAPLGYVFQREIDTIYTAAGSMKNPSYLFIDGQHHLWISDTDNNRLLELRSDGSLVREVGKGVLLAPQGLFVTENGDIFVADGGHGEVVRFDKNGQKVSAFGKPQAYVLSSDASYKPTRVVVDKRGYLYIINGGGDYRGIIQLDEEGIFRGFYGANHNLFDLSRAMTRAFASADQKRQLSRTLPSSDSSLFIDASGFIYTTSATAPTGQIKKLNAIGNNVLRLVDRPQFFGLVAEKTGGFFGETPGTGRNQQRPQFVDITVDDRGLFTALDSNSGKVYQYDQSGNMLTVFGGKGWQEGVFDYPSSLKVDQDGSIYVLDSSRKNIQVFRPTQFAALVQNASVLYYDGKYEEAAAVWKEVARLDTNYLLAHSGLGKAYQKREQYQEAMREFQAADDRKGYSGAFAEYRQVYMREHFPQVAGLFVLAMVVLVLITRGARRVMMATSGSAA